MQSAEKLGAGEINSIQIDPEMRLTRSETAQALSAIGFKTTTSTLATKAVRGGGPVYQLFGTRPLYRWGDALEWAYSKLSLPIRNSSER